MRGVVCALDFGLVPVELDQACDYQLELMPGLEIDDDEDESPATPVDDVAGVGAEAAAKGAEDVGSVDALPATTAMPASTNKA